MRKNQELRLRAVARKGTGKVRTHSRRSREKFLGDPTKLSTSSHQHLILRKGSIYLLSPWHSDRYGSWEHPASLIVGNKRAGNYPLKPFVIYHLDIDPKWPGQMPLGACMAVLFSKVFEYDKKACTKTFTCVISGCFHL